MANNLNNISVKNIGILCAKYFVKLIHISTDYVFNSKSPLPICEDTKTKPINYYGTTKLNGEISLIQNSLKNSIILRTSWLYSNGPNNFFYRIIKKLKNDELISVVDNEFGSI